MYTLASYKNSSETITKSSIRVGIIGISKTDNLSIFFWAIFSIKFNRTIGVVHK